VLAPSRPTRHPPVSSTSPPPFRNELRLPAGGICHGRPSHCTLAVTEAFPFSEKAQVFAFWPPLLQAPDQMTSRPLVALSVMRVPTVKEADWVLPTATLMPAGLESTRSPARPVALTVRTAVPTQTFAWQLFPTGQVPQQRIPPAPASGSAAAARPRRGTRGRGAAGVARAGRPGGAGAGGGRPAAAIRHAAAARAERRAGPRRHVPDCTVSVSDRV